jgi:hypothetical protein
MLQEPEHPYDIQEIETRSDVGRAVLHDILEHLEAKNWIACERRAVPASDRDSNTIARSYRMTDHGLREAPKALHKHEQLRLQRLRRTAPET